MTAIYQNNFKKISKYVEKPLVEFMNFDPRAYPNHEHKFVHDFLWHALDPWKETYSSRLTHINLYQVTVAKQINKLPSILVRDGLFTLIDFFIRCPNPKLIHGIFIVHNCLRDFIPDKWRAKVLFYEFEYRNDFTKSFQQKNNQVLLKANVTNGIFDYTEALKIALDLKNKGYEKLHLFFFNKSNHFLATEWDADYRTNDFVLSQSAFLNALSKEKIQYETNTWKEFFNAQGTHQYDCYDLNYKEKFYIDDFSNYYFLKKGATPLYMETMKANSSDLYVPLSNFHGVRVFSTEPKYESKKIDTILKNLSMFNSIKEKCDVGSFQLINEIAGNKLGSAWVKRFT